LFVHVTFVPGATIIVTGENAKFAMLMKEVAGFGVGTGAGVGVVGVGVGSGVVGAGVGVGVGVGVTTGVVGCVLSPV
jgi:hypothetical protein